VNRIIAYAYKQQYKPGIIGLFINPFYYARTNLYHHVRKYSHYIRGRVLDIGCGNKPYEDIIHCEEYVGLEIDTEQNRSSKKADFFYDGGTFPFKDIDFDSIIISQVLEHIFEPEFFLSEVRRVLKPCGTLLLTVPFVWDEHDQPLDYARYSSFGIKYLLEKHGFSILHQDKLGDDAGMIFQLANAYMYKLITTKHKYITCLLMTLFCFPVNCIGVLMSKIFPKNKDLYLDNLIIAQKGQNL
jgi:SAM-dependent methyltransferase